jgi:tetratricopeptide (TPR) repeat protein
VLVFVAIAGYAWWTRHAATRTTQAWAELSRAMDTGSPDLLATVADEYPNTVVGQTASAVLGDLRLFTACNQCFSSATRTDKDLKDAQEAYSRILDNSRSDALSERATFGMARVRETNGKLDDAKRYYQEVVERWPDGAFAPAAKQRLADFKEAETKLMFASLAKAERKGEFSEEPGTMGTQPPSAPPTFDMPQEPPVGNAPVDVGDDLLKGLEKSSPAPAEKSDAGVGKKTDNKSNGKKADGKTTDAPAKKP